MDIASESRNFPSLTFLPKSQFLFAFLRWLKHLFPGIKETRLNSLRGGIYCPNSYTKMDNDPSSLTLMGGSPTNLEMCAGFLHSWGRKMQPPHALPQLMTNSALPRAAGTLQGEVPDVVDEWSQDQERTPRAFVCHPSFAPEWKWEVFSFFFFSSCFFML